MLFEFNRWSALLLPFFLQGILFTFLLLWRGFREERLSDKLLAALILIFTLRVANWMLGFAYWYDAHDWHSTFMFYFPFTYWFLIGPLVYFYFRSLTNRDFRFETKDFWHFVPAMIDFLGFVIVFIIDVVIQHWWRGKPFPYHFATQGNVRLEGIPFWDEIAMIGTLISLLVYFIRTIRLHRQYREVYLNSHFSDTEKIKFTWLRNFLYTVLAAVLIWLVFFIVDYAGAQPLDYIQLWYSHFAWGICIYYLSISGYYTLPEVSLQLHFEPETSNILLSQEPVDQQWKQKLLALMAMQKPHLQPELTLNDLANLLKIPPNNLSKLINSGFHQNFNDFINAYRVETVKEKLLDANFQHLSLLGIAFESGFNSKATFNRAFRKHTGISPSEFVAAQKTKSDSNSNLESLNE